MIDLIISIIKGGYDTLKLIKDFILLCFKLISVLISFIPSPYGEILLSFFSVYGAIVIYKVVRGD